MNDGHRRPAAVTRTNPIAAGSNPAPTGESLRGNHSLYAVADQTLWRPDAESDRGIGVFARVAGVPAGRNTLDLAFDAGVTWQGMIPGRDEDVLGLAVSVARVSDAARTLVPTRRWTRCCGGARRCWSSPTPLRSCLAGRCSPWGRSSSHRAPRPIASAPS